jgi:hypothetical protein
MRSVPSGATERAFSVADALVLIGAAAAGLALVRGWQEPYWCSIHIGFYPGQTSSLARRIQHAFSVGISWTIPFAMTLTIALVALRFRSPRPTFRRIARQPGAVACASALAAIAFRLGAEVSCWVLGYLTRPQSQVNLPSPPSVRLDNPGFHPPAGQWLRNALLEPFPILVSPSVAIAVTVGWCVLRASGRWRSDPGWIDRSGRWLGSFWIALGVVLEALMELSKFIM